MPAFVSVEIAVTSFDVYCLSNTLAVPVTFTVQDLDIVPTMDCPNMIACSQTGEAGFVFMSSVLWF